MSTALFNLGRAIPERLSELYVLTERARLLQDKDEEFYNAICRGCAVLLAAHLEGFIKDLSFAIVDDLNSFYGVFDRLPEALKHSFCLKIAYFEGVPTADVQVRVRQLLKFFEKNSVKIDPSAFSYKENVNKNPGGMVVDNQFEKLGVPAIVRSLATSTFLAAFNNSDSTTAWVKKRVRSGVGAIYSYPTSQRRMGLVFDRQKRDKKDAANNTLWSAFIDEVMSRRHKIAHGELVNNEDTWDDLLKSIDKMNILLHGLLLSAAAFLIAKR